MGRSTKLTLAGTLCSTGWCQTGSTRLANQTNNLGSDVGSGDSGLVSQDLAAAHTQVRMGFQFFSFRRRNHKRAMSSVVVFTVTSTHTGAMDDDACFRLSDGYDNTTVPYITTEPATVTLPT